MGVMPTDHKDTLIEDNVLLSPEFLASVPVTHFSAKATSTPSSCHDDDNYGGWFSKSVDFTPRWS